MIDGPRRSGPPGGQDGRGGRGGRGEDGPRGRGGRGGPDENGPPGRGPDGSGPMGSPLDFQSLQTRDPELYKLTQQDRDLERQTHDLVDQFRRTGSSEQAKLKEKLADTVNKHFAVRQQLRTLEVKRLEQQVKQLRDRIEQREKDRKDIVAKRIDELTGADDGERF